MDTFNPYRSPQSEIPRPAPPRYHSRWQAARAGMRWGATLGAKWVGGILFLLSTLVWLVFGVGTAYQWLERGVPLSRLIDKLQPLQLLLLMIRALVVSTLFAALVCAILAGLAAALAHHTHDRGANNLELPHSPLPADRGEE